MEPLASIIMFTYNHKDYIEEAVESCLSQVTDFSYNLVICDDASTDGTTEIIQGLQKKHANIVHSLQKANSNGQRNMADGFNLIKSKYIAFCEGDDFWTVPYKLQKQVSFLEANPDFNVSTHRTSIFHMEQALPAAPHHIYKNLQSENERIAAGIFYPDEAIANYYFHTSSFVFRWKYRDGLPPWWKPYMFIDHVLFLLHAEDSKIKYFDEEMSTWRRHATGYSWEQTYSKELFFRNQCKAWLHFYSEVDEFFGRRFHFQIRERILLALRGAISSCIESQDINRLKEIIIDHFDYIKKPILENKVLYDALALVYPKEKDMHLPWGTVNSRNKEKESKESKEAFEAPPIGAFIGFDMESIPLTENSIWDAWVGDSEYALFANLRSALLNYLRERGVSEVWIPSYYSPQSMQALRIAEFTLFRYPSGAYLNPSPDFLDALEPNTAVIVHSPLGRHVGQEMIEALSKRDDLVRIEDRSHCLDAYPNKGVDAVIYSPRYLVGVPDGGILVGKGVAAYDRAHSFSTLDDRLSRITTCMSSYEDPLLTTKPQYLLAEQEARTFTPLGGASKLTSDTLKRLPMQTLAAKRRKNWETLYSIVKKYAFWDIAKPDFSPLSFPIYTPSKITAATLAHAMLHHNISCTRYWDGLYLGNNKDWMEVRLSERLLTLPCDHRYGEEEMEKVARLAIQIIEGHK